MKRHNVILESNVEPKDNNVLWLQGNKLKKFGNTGWENIVEGDVVTTDRIENGAVTTDKIATNAFDSTLSKSEKIAPANIVGNKITTLEEKVDALAIGRFYGYFPDSTSLPTDVTTPGYSYVGLGNPYKIWNFNGESWSDSGTSIDMNDADEEDITRNVDGKLQFKDRSYGDGMGYVILRKDKTFAEQVTQANTIYEIRYDFEVGSDFVLDGVNNITLFLNGGNLILSENNIKFNNIDGLHIIALHGEKFIATGGYSYIPPQGETWNGIVELYSCKNVSIKGVEFVYNNVLANFIYAEDCEDAIYDGNKFSGLTSSSDMPLLPKKCIFSIGGIRTNYTNNIITDVRGGFTIGNYLKVEKNVVFSNNIVKNTILSGVNCYSKNASFHGNAFENIGFGGSVTAISICGYGGEVESDSISITGNVFIDCCNAIQSDTQNSGHIHHIDVCGNTIKNCNRAIYMACSDNILVSNNIMTGSSIICIDCSDVQHAIISGNLIDGELSSSPSSPTYGIRILPIDTNALDCEDIAIINNKIKTTDRGIYVGYSISHPYISKQISLTGNEVTNCGTGLLVVPATEKLYLSNNQIVDNTIDVDIRTNDFELDGNNYFNSISPQTSLLHNLDTTSAYPVVNYENGVYTLSSDSAYILRGFTAPSSVNRVMIYVLSENITIAQGGGLNTITRASLNPLRYSCLMFRRDGNSWFQISSEGFLKVVSEVSSFKTNRSMGLVLYNSSLNKPVVCAGNRWVLMDGYSAISRSGSSRPTNLVAEDTGMMFFDTTVGKPIWWTGTKWVDATGADA